MQRHHDKILGATTLSVIASMTISRSIPPATLSHLLWSPQSTAIYCFLNSYNGVGKGLSGRQVCEKGKRI